jgi:phosphonopyruvate decarboxylase
MIPPAQFAEALDRAGITFFTGVPDSLLKDICACLTTSLPPEQHIIATNEGSAVGLAIGHFLATGRPALVYMQNSGLGNAINPLASLADPLVYGIPMLLMIGWRGELSADGTQIHDEPQHVKQGQITLAQLEVLGVPHQIVAADVPDVAAVIERATADALSRPGPVALVVRKGTFASSTLPDSGERAHLGSREDAIQRVADALPDDTPIVSTTGMASRELFEYRKVRRHGHRRDFLTVGGMGHACQIAAGIALAQPSRKVVCLDGDGAMLMHLAALAIAARRKNMIHVVINNGAHDSVGGQPTLATELDLVDIARSLGYASAVRVTDLSGVAGALRQALDSDASAFIEIACRKGARANLGRPDTHPEDNKAQFMRFLTQESA